MELFHIMKFSYFNRLFPTNGSCSNVGRMQCSTPLGGSSKYTSVDSVHIWFIAMGLKYYSANTKTFSWRDTCHWWQWWIKFSYDANINAYKYWELFDQKLQRGGNCGENIWVLLVICAVLEFVGINAIYLGSSELHIDVDSSWTMCVRYIIKAQIKKQIFNIIGIPYRLYEAFRFDYCWKL